jgi:hypothetical protein
MPRFLAQTYKTHPKGKWSNVYGFVAATLAAATADMVDILTNLEKPLLHPSVVLASIRISSAIPFDDSFTITPIGENGTSADAADLLPFFNCVRVDIGVIGGGRPSRKYWKGLLTETLVTGMQVTPGALAAIETGFNGAIAAAEAAVMAFSDNDGQDWDTAVAVADVQMRQMHRKRRKKVVAP